jgi:S1-C subfamily serine protease
MGKMTARLTSVELQKIVPGEPATIRFRSCALMMCVLLGAATLSGQAARLKSSPTDAQERVRRAVVELLAVGPGDRGNNRECEATGLLINEEGFILTNAHVVEQARECLAGSPSAKILARPATPDPSVGSAVSCDVVSLDELHDLALLKAERPLFDDLAEAGMNYLALDLADVEDGAEVAVTGHPAFAWQPLTQSGRVLRHATLALSDTTTAESQVIILNIALRKGNSGSPVYRANDGSVVGIVERKDLRHPSQSVAVPIRYAIEMLDRTGVKWHAGEK